MGLRHRLSASAAVIVTATGTVTGVAYIKPAPAQAATSLSARWTVNLPNVVLESSPLAVDLDGQSDVVVGAHDGRVYAVHTSDGSTVAGWPYNTGNPIDSSPSAADTNFDGKNEVYIASGLSGGGSGDLFALSNTGALRWRFHPSDPSNLPVAFLSSPTIGDVNGDGVPDISAMSLGLQDWSFAENGAMNRGWPFYADDTTDPTPALLDVNGDGKPDYIVGGASSPGGPVDLRGGLLRAISGDGSLIWSHDFDEVIRGAPAIGDIDGDGKPEIVVGTSDYWAQNGGSTDVDKIYVFDMHGNLKWVRDLGGVTNAAPALADVNGDGRLDVVEGLWGGANAGKVFVLDGATGNPLPNWNGRSTPGQILGQISTADIDGDGAQDLVVGVGGGTYIYSGRTGALMYSIDVGTASFQNTALLTDPLGNGAISLIIAGGRPNGTGFISRYDLPSSASISSSSWPMYMRDNRRTGSVVPSNLGTNYCANGQTDGYRLTAADGGVFSYCNAPFEGSSGSIHLNKPVVASAPTTDNLGYWQVASDGGVFAFGDAPFEGSAGNIPLQSPIVGMTPTPDGRGYYLVAADGGIFTYGDAVFRGSTGNVRLNRPIVGMALTADGGGYWLVASDGGIFAYGDAVFRGSTGNIKLNRPIVGMALTADGGGYWLVASDGGIFAYGNAPFYGSTGGTPLINPIVGISRARSGGYRLVASDGGVFAFSASYFGSTGGIRLNQPIVGISN